MLQTIFGQDHTHAAYNHQHSYHIKWRLRNVAIYMNIRFGQVNYFFTLYHP